MVKKLKSQLICLNLELGWAKPKRALNLVSKLNGSIYFINS